MTTILELAKLVISEFNIGNEARFTKKEFAKIASEYSEIEADEISVIVHDDIGTFFRKPICLLSYHVVYNPWIGKIIFRRILHSEEMGEFSKLHEQTIEQLLEERILNLSPRAFEYLICRLMTVSKDPDFLNVKPTSSSSDGGVDVRADLEEEGKKIRVIVEAKLWSKPITPGVVDRLARVMELEEREYGRQVRGVITSFHGSTEGARKRAFGKDMEFWSKETIVRMMMQNETGMKKTYVPSIDIYEWENYESRGEDEQ